MSKFKVGDIVNLNNLGKLYLDDTSAILKVIDVREITNPFGYSSHRYLLKYMNKNESRSVDEAWIDIDVEYTRELKLNSLLDDYEN